MRDGEHKGKKVEVVPNSAIRLNYGEGEDDCLMVSASHDLVVRFVEPQYNYLRYFDPHNMNIIAVFLGHEVLADLMDAGIPATNIREQMLEGEMEAYEHHLAKIAMAEVEMEPVPELSPSELMEAELQRAQSELEGGGLEWFLGEWADGRDGS